MYARSQKSIVPYVQERARLINPQNVTGVTHVLRTSAEGTCSPLEEDEVPWALSGTNELAMAAVESHVLITSEPSTPLSARWFAFEFKGPGKVGSAKTDLLSATTCMKHRARMQYVHNRNCDPGQSRHEECPLTGVCEFYGSTPC